jgi:hypothetical protein
MTRQKSISVRALSWPYGGLLLVTVAVLLLATPADLEGPVLFPISPGHALSVLDCIALVPLLAGMTWLYIGLWKRRKHILEVTQSSPGRSILVVFIGGFGLGLLIASAFSSFFWWWAIGAILFAAMLIVAILVGVRQ